MQSSTEENALQAGGQLRYEQVARSIAEAIASGRLQPGDRIPTVRRLASDLNVSMTTVNTAFGLLAERGLIRSEVGRGTFVADPPAIPPAVSTVRFPRYAGGHLRRSGKVPWRRRALMTSASRLRAVYPNATDCSTGRPDPALLPLELIRRNWQHALQDVTSADLQYTTSEPIQPLAEALVERLNADEIAARGGDLVIGTSAQQFMALILDIIAGLWGPENAVIAVEQPGYPTIFDTWEHAGARLVGIAVDEEGAMPDSLAKALEAGTKAVLFTPRAHNPTGASWSAQRASALAAVLKEYSEVIAIEDDHFADISNARPGSLLNCSGVEDRVLYLRSFSKSIAPDMRIAVAVVRQRLKALLQEAKSHADGWTSRLLQRVLAHVLMEDELNTHFASAREAYWNRRQRAATAINSSSSGASAWLGPDGLNLWVHLPSGVDATEAVDLAAAAGVVVAPGEPFYLSPGRSDVLRFNAGSVGSEQAAGCAQLLASAILQTGRHAPAPMHV